MFLLKIFGFVKGRRVKRKKSFETNLIRLISSLLVILFLSVIVLYYSSIKSVYSEQLEKSNDSIIEQVAISFEMIMKQITDGIYKIPLYDTEMIQLIKNNKQNVLYQMDLQRKLDSIVLGNSYLYSSYLYLPAQNIVYSSQSGNSYPLDRFPDIQAIVLTSKGTISILDPRIVDSPQGKNLLISVICPVPLYQGEYEGLLVVNIDANRLYYDVLKKIKTDENMNFYVYNKENTMIINKDASLLFKAFTPQAKSTASGGYFHAVKNIISQHKVITSSYHSKDLQWNFVLETSINSTSIFLARLYSIVISLIILLLISLLIVIWIVKFSTKPMKKVLSSYNEKLWIDFLTDSSVDSDELYRQLELDSTHFTYDTYATIVLQLTKTDISQSTFNQYLAGIKSFIGPMKPLYDMNILVIHKNQIAILVNFEQKAEAGSSEQSLGEFAHLIYNSLDADIRPLVYMSISTPKENVQMLPAAYRECIESLNYKIHCGGSHILHYSSVKGTKQDSAYEYPYELEKQLNNNLIVGNPGACEIFLEKFFTKLAEPEFNLSDNEIKNFIYQLQTSILKTVSSLPISVKIDGSMNILDLYDLGEIKNKVSDFVIQIASEMGKTEENEEFTLLNNILEFIDKKFMNEDFNLNSAADALSMNRNYLTKIIKEKSGYSFNEYVTKKRISMAKILLQDKNTPIESIAHKVGFNYSHYFIKVFKTLEGITPGQYRDRVLENTPPENDKQ